VPHFSALTWRILAFNALALIVLTGGVILVQASGRGLVEERLNSIQEQANIVAGTLAEYATDPETHTLKVSTFPMGIWPSTPATSWHAMWCRPASCRRWITPARSSPGSSVCMTAS
jgi:hypothetical protein